MSRRLRTAAILAVSAASVAAGIVSSTGVAGADVCANVGRRISVGGCVNVADAIGRYAPPPAYYAPLPQDYPPPPPPPP